MSGDQLDLDAARIALTRDECDRRGHDWTVHATLGGSPTAVTCDRCGRADRVTTSDVGMVLRERYDDAITTGAAMSRRALAAEAEVRRLRAEGERMTEDMADALTEAYERGYRNSVNDNS